MPVRLIVEPGFPLEGTFQMRVPSAYGDELADDLLAAGIQPEPVIEHGDIGQVASWIVSASALPSLAGVIYTFLHRDDGKEFKVAHPDGSSVETKGYAISKEAILEHLERLADNQRESDEKWRQAIERKVEDDEPDS